MINGVVALIGYVVAGFNENATILFGVIALMIVSYVSISKIVGEKVNDNAVVDVEEAV